MPTNRKELPERPQIGKHARDCAQRYTCCRGNLTLRAGSKFRVAEQGEHDLYPVYGEHLAGLGHRTPMLWLAPGDKDQERWSFQICVACGIHEVLCVSAQFFGNGWRNVIRNEEDGALTFNHQAAQLCEYGSHRRRRDGSLCYHYVVHVRIAPGNANQCIGLWGVVVRYRLDLEPKAGQGLFGTRGVDHMFTFNLMFTFFERIGILDESVRLFKKKVRSNYLNFAKI
jgi:hypothetical protein